LFAIIIFNIDGKTNYVGIEYTTQTKKINQIIDWVLNDKKILTDKEKEQFFTRVINNPNVDTIVKNQIF